MRSILLDTNLLVLLVVGLYERSLIAKHKNTNSFTEEDFDLLRECLAKCNKIWITSHCLAETSNLLKQTPNSTAQNLLRMLAEICSQKEAVEYHIEKEHIFSINCFPRLGVADAGLLVSAKSVDYILTDDFDAYHEILNQYPDKTYNFTHLRQNNFFNDN